MAPKLWRESYSAKGMHALIDYHRSDILPSNVERLCEKLNYSHRINNIQKIKIIKFKKIYLFFIFFLFFF